MVDKLNTIKQQLVFKLIAETNEHKDFMNAIKGFLNENSTQKFEGTINEMRITSEAWNDNDIEMRFDVMIEDKLAQLKAPETE